MVAGELAFLAQHWLQFEVRNLDIKWGVTVKQGRLQMRQEPQADVILSADAHDFILMAVREEDPDMLFFQRRLRIEGDTEPGFQVQNLMDSIELDAMATAAENWIAATGQIYRLKDYRRVR